MQQSQLQDDNTVPTVLSPFTSPPSTPSGSHHVNADEDCDQQESGFIIEGSAESCVTDGNNKKELFLDLVWEEDVFGT